MERKKYRWCVVPQCTNTSKTTPNKIFIDVPRKADIRKKWLDLARRQCYGMSVTSPIYFCEVHFDLPNDMENYMRYHVMGTVDKVMLKRGCLPTKFQCQSDRKRSLPSTVTFRPAAIKRQRLALVQEALEYSSLESDTKEVKTLSPSLPVEVIVEHQPKTQDKGVQVFVKSTYFRSKLTQTENQSFSIGTSPFKTWTSTVSTSPFKVEHVKPAMPSASKTHKKLVVARSDSDTSLCSLQSIFQQTSPSVQSLQLKSLSESSSLNEEETILEKNREKKQDLDKIEKNTNIPIMKILLSLKKIRLNTTFSELSDQFGISTSYAGKIFMYSNDF